MINIILGKYTNPCLSLRPAKSFMGQPMNINIPIPKIKAKYNLHIDYKYSTFANSPIAYITAVKAIQAATNLALGFTLKINTPLIIIPKPITRIPPTPEIEQNNTNRNFR